LTAIALIGAVPRDIFFQAIVVVAFGKRCAHGRDACNRNSWPRVARRDAEPLGGLVARSRMAAFPVASLLLSRLSSLVELSRRRAATKVSAATEERPLSRTLETKKRGSTNSAIPPNKRKK